MKGQRRVYERRIYACVEIERTGAMGREIGKDKDIGIDK